MPAADRSACAFSIAGVGSALPSQVVTNAMIADRIGLPEQRIASLFDIRERRWSRHVGNGHVLEGESIGQLATAAARSALSAANIDAHDVDAVFAVSTTARDLSPPLDYSVERGLGCREVFAVTIHAACAGLFRAALLTENLIRTGSAKAVVIVAADTISPFFTFATDLPKDLRLSMALYGDGAAAMVVSPPAPNLPSVRSIVARTTATEQLPGIALSQAEHGSNHAESGVDPCGTVTGYHDFSRVLRQGGELTVRAAHAVLERAGLSLDEVDHLLTHQATGNMRRVARELGLPAEKLRINIETVGNTLAPSILILLDELRRAGELHSGDTLLLHTAESATWSYGGMLIDWAG